MSVNTIYIFALVFTPEAFLFYHCFINGLEPMNELGKAAVPVVYCVSSDIIMS